MLFYTDHHPRRPRRVRRVFTWVAYFILAASIGGAVQAQPADELKAIHEDRSKKDAAAAPKSDEVADNADPAELARHLTELEARIRELEARLAKLNEAPPRDAARVDEVAEIKKEVAAIQEDAKKDSGFLQFFRKTEVSGTVDAYYGYNFNHPDKNFNIGRNFDFYHNNFNLNYLELVFEKKPELDDRIGYRFDLGFGPTADWVHGADPAGGEVVKHFQQAYLSYLAPVGKGLQIDFGKFVTPHGAEVIETKDNLNYSRGFLFAYAIPYYHTGLRAKYTFNDKFAMSGFLVNGWNNFIDNNGAKTFGVELALTPTKSLSIMQHYMAGPEQPNDNEHWRHLSDTLVSYTASNKLTLMGNFDYGADTLTSGKGGHWKGFAGYFRYAFTPKFSIVPRYEVFDDHDGFTTGLAQRLQEFTVTPEFKLASNLLMRFEFRHDHSDKDFFNKSAGRPVGSQNSVLLGFVYWFSTRGE